MHADRISFGGWSWNLIESFGNKWRLNMESYYRILRGMIVKKCIVCRGQNSKLPIATKSGFQGKPIKNPAKYDGMLLLILFSCCVPTRFFFRFWVDCSWIQYMLQLRNIVGIRGLTWYNHTNWKKAVENKQNWKIFLIFHACKCPTIK